MGTMTDNIWNILKSSGPSQGSRKTWVTLAALLMGVAVDHFCPNGISPNMTALILGVVGTFTVGNLGEHMAKAKQATQEYTINTQAYEEEEAPIDDSLQVVRKDVAELKEAAMAHTGALKFLVGYIQQAEAAQTNKT